MQNTPSQKAGINIVADLLTFGSFKKTEEVGSQDARCVRLQSHCRASRCEHDPMGKRAALQTMVQAAWSGIFSGTGS